VPGIVPRTTVLALVHAEASDAYAVRPAFTPGLSRSRSGPTRGAISAEFHTCNGNLEPAVLLHLFFQVVEESAFKLPDSATTQTGDVHMLARRLALVKMLLALEMHQIEFINQPMSLQKSQGPIDRDAIDFWLLLLRLAQNLCGIEMAAGGLYDAQNRTALPRHANAARREF